MTGILKHTALRAALVVLSAVIMLGACQEDVFNSGSATRTDRLTARKVARETRTVPPNSNFAQNTRYRLWAYNPDNGNSYMFGNTNGIPGRESVGNYVEMDQDYARLLRNRFDIYGFTDNVVYADDNDARIPVPDGTVDAPTYLLQYEQDLPHGYRDYMRAKLSYDFSTGTTSPVLEFRHILCRVRVQVIQQDNEGQTDNDGNLIGMYDLRLHKAEIVGVYNNEIYNVRDSAYTLPDGDTSTSRTLNKVADGEPIVPAEASVAPFSESYLFPTLEAEKGKLLTMRLIISGADASKFSTTPATGEDANPAPDGTTKYVVTVDLNDRNIVDENGQYSTPLVFEQNCAYMLRVVFSRDGIVTYTPLVYPWFDGETEGWEDGEGYDEQPIGNSFLFDNLIWSDRNLGADHYLPSDAKSFRECAGFYYQYDRNIPYFPMVLDDNGNLQDNLVDSTYVYPMVSKEAGGNNRFDVPIRMSSKEHGGNGTHNPAAELIVTVDGIPDSTALGYSLSFNCCYDGFNNGLWKNISTQPTPPGWRLPTDEELAGVLPSNTASGNITMRRDVRWTGMGDAGVAASPYYFNNWSLNQYLYVHIPYDANYPAYPPVESIYNQRQGWENGGPDGDQTWKPEGDPSPGYASEYVISKKYPGEATVTVPAYGSTNAAHVCATIYGIKKVGTNEAYRMRWQIRAISNTGAKENYYVLVCERFTATATDRLTYADENAANHYRKYDWSRPVATIYFPLSGMIADEGMDNEKRDGTLINFGMETILGTSTPATFYPQRGNDNLHYRGYWTYRMKVGGSNCLNQYIFPAIDRRGVGCQLRLVRESTYQPDPNQ